MDLAHALRQFSGSDQIYRLQFGLLYTDGVKYLADEAGAYWLIDAVASYQPQLAKNQRLADFQLWELNVKDQQAVLTCREDSGMKPMVQQEIEYTDFPLDYIKLYVEGGVLLLPSER